MNQQILLGVSSFCGLEVVKKCFDAVRGLNTKNAINTLMLMSNHVPLDGPQRAPLLHVATFYKVKFDMSISIESMLALGANAQVRSKREAFSKTETLLMTSLARWRKRELPSLLEMRATL